MDENAEAEEEPGESPESHMKADQSDESSAQADESGGSGMEAGEGKDSDVQPCEISESSGSGSSSSSSTISTPSSASETEVSEAPGEEKEDYEDADRKPKKQKRGMSWGPFSIAPVSRRNNDGTFTLLGYGCVCGRHRNVNDSIECKKQLCMGKSLSADECRVRLKLWLLEGVQLDDLPMARTAHLRHNPRLIQLVPEEDADRRLAESGLV